MAKTKISEFSATPGNNTDIDGINIAEGCAPSGINNAIRELMSQLKDFQTGAAGDSFNGPVGTSTAAAGAFTTLTTSGAVTHNGGTANGVAYLNGSKVLTTGSALTFDGTTLATTGKFGVTGGGSLPTASALQIGTNGAGSRWLYNVPTGGEHNFTVNNSVISFQTENAHGWFAGGSEQMRLTSTGLGIGTSSPASRVDVNGKITLRNGSDSRLGYIQNTGGALIIGSETGGTTEIVFQTNGTTERARITSSGDFLVGTTNSDISSVTGWNLNRVGSGGATVNISNTNEAFIYNNLSTAGTAQIDFRTAGAERGNISWNNTSTSYNTSSDYRLKENIQPMTGALAKVVALKPCTYKWKADGSDGEGFIAHELAEVAPQCVTGEKDAVDEDGKPVYQGIDTSFLVATLTAAIQELKAELDAYKATHP